MKLVNMFDNVMAIALVCFSSLLLGMVTCHTMDMGTCRMICDHSLEDPSALERECPQGTKGDVGAKGQKGEPAAECVCSGHSVFQPPIGELNDKLRKIHSPVNCTEVILRRRAHRGGRFTIYPDSFGEKGVDVYCDTKTDGGGWTVFQRRMDGSVDFFRGWDDYVNGFGDLNGEFWLGLENIYKLMEEGSYELRVDLEDFDGNVTYAKYSTFELGGPESFFNATISGYAGTAGNSLGVTNVSFSTKDQDHDTHSVNCANVYKGATWYTTCHSANLNGLYLGGKHKSYADGVNWRTWKGYYYSLKFSEMKIRRIA